MYEIRKDDAVLALTEKPNYIYRHEDGFYALCDEAQAQGIAVNGTPYSLHGRPAIEGCETVILVETDAGTLLVEAGQAKEDADALNVDQEYRLTMLELGITDTGTDAGTGV